jgi:hypothetical protein
MKNAEKVLEVRPEMVESYRDFDRPLQKNVG